MHDYAIDFCCLAQFQRDLIRITQDLRNVILVGEFDFYAESLVCVELDVLYNFEGFAIRVLGDQALGQWILLFLLQFDYFAITYGLGMTICAKNLLVKRLLPQEVF